MSTSSLPRILIVDDSRIVRATIIKRICDRFDAREEVDGEAGWEALLIDPTLQLIITDHTMPRLDGHGLIERIRGSRVSRIRNIPVIMISGDEDEASRQRAKDVGATDFIAKGTGTAELLARLDTLINLGRTHGELELARAAAMTDAASGLLTEAALRRQADQLLSYARRQGGRVGILAIGMDRASDSVADGGKVARQALLAGFAKMLGGMVRREDALARWQDDTVVVVTPGLDARQTYLFGDRLRNAAAGSSIQLGEQALSVTITVGIAGYPDDGDRSEDLVAVASKRLAEGWALGGNRVLGGNLDLGAQARDSVDAALLHLAAGRESAVMARLPDLGRAIFPMLRLIDRELRLGLPLADIEGKLAAARDGQFSIT